MPGNNWGKPSRRKRDKARREKLEHPVFEEHPSETRGREKARREDWPGADRPDDDEQPEEPEAPEENEDEEEDEEGEDDE